MEMLFGVAVVGIFACVILIFAKKGHKAMQEILAEFSSEQKEDLKDNQVEIKDSNQNSFSWYQKGLIGKVTAKGNNYHLVVIYFNTVMNNNYQNDFEYADIKIKKTDFESKGLQKGSVITMLIEPHKTRATIV